MTETHQRTLARAISYRIVALLITAIWTGLGDAVIIHVILTALHYLFERLWLRISWGLRSAPTQPSVFAGAVDQANHVGHGSLDRVVKRSSDPDTYSRH